MGWGIDISNHQAGADLSKAKAAGCSFVFAKATEGLTYVDDHFAGFRAQASKVGLRFGAYHFARPQAGRTGAQEARHFLAIAGTSHDLPPVLDLESNGVESPPGSGRWINRLSKSALTRFTQDFLAAVEKATGRTPIIYTGSWFWSDQVTPLASFARYPLWLANYQTATPPAPAPWASWVAWQHTSGATVPGIPGRCDRNIAAAGFPPQEDDVTPDDIKQAVIDALKTDGLVTAPIGSNPTVAPVTALRYAMEWSLAARNAAQVAANAPGVTAQQIADAIPDDLAKQVVDALAVRLKEN